MDKTKMLEMSSQQNEVVKFVKEVDGLLVDEPGDGRGEHRGLAAEPGGRYAGGDRSIIKMANNAVFEQELEQFVFGHPRRSLC